MKERDIRLTVQETEQLCRMYMDCRLSVLEETELQYVLGKFPYSSPVIDETRALMGMVMLSEVRRSSGVARRRMARRIAGIAASVVLISVAAFTAVSVSHEMKNDDTFVVAYESGRKLDSEDAEIRVEDAMAKAESLMAKAREVEQASIERERFFRNQTPEIK